jgi:hypothetical protein
MTHEPAQWADLVAHLRFEVASWRMASQEAELEVAALRKQRDAAHREGYEMARAEARELGVFLRRYDLAKNRHDNAK